MAINGSNAKIFTSLRDSLASSNIDTNITGNLGFSFGGSDLAGVTPEMAANISKGINDYKARVESILNKLEAVDSQGAFRGSQITNSLKTFIESVKSVSINYLSALQNAEHQIVNSVAAAYQQQDADVSGQINQDSSSVEGSKVSF